MSWQSWTAQEVADWTSGIGPKYKELADAFLEAGVDGSFLENIADEDLQELGLNSGFLRKRFNHKLKILRATADSGGGVIVTPKPNTSPPVAPVLPSPPQRKSHPVPPVAPGAKSHPIPPVAPGAKSHPVPPVAPGAKPPAAPGAKSPSAAPRGSVRNRISALQRQISGANIVKDSSPSSPPPKPPASFTSMKKKLSDRKQQSDDPFADYSATTLSDAIYKNAVDPVGHPPPPKPMGFNPPKAATTPPAAPGMKAPPPAPASGSSISIGGDNIPPPPGFVPPPPVAVSKPPPAPGASGPGAPPPGPGTPPPGPGSAPAGPGAPPPGPGAPPPGPGSVPGGPGSISLPPPPPRASVNARTIPLLTNSVKSLDDTPDLPGFDDAPPGAGPGSAPPPSPGIPSPAPAPNPGATPGGPGMAPDVSQSGNPDYHQLNLPRPTQTDNAAIEFSTAIALCCASLQLNIDHLELLNNIANRLQGRDQVKLDLTNAKVTRDLTTHEEFLQVCYLIGFELDESGESLICQNPPADDILKVFNDVVKEFQYSSPTSYSVEEHVNDLETGEIDILKIVIALTHEYTQQSEDALEALTLFLPYITNFPTFLKILRCWFEWCATRSGGKMNRTGNVRYKLATIVKYLLKEHRLELTTGDSENKALQDLLDVIKNEDLIAFSHIEAVIRQSNAAMNMPDDVIEGAAAEKIDLLQLKPDMLAEQMCIIDQKLFSLVTFREIFDQNLSDTVLAEYIQRYQNIIRWIQLAVYLEKNLESRAQRIRWIFKMGETLLANQNYFSFLACLDALDSIELQAFETSWALVNKKKWSSKRDYAKLYQDWQKYRDESYVSECFWGLTAPAVPSYRVVLKNSVVKDEYRANAQSQVELFCYYRKLWPLAKLVRSLQQTPYELDTSVQVQHELEATLRQQSQLKSQDMSMMFLQALNTDGLSAPVGLSGPRMSMIR